MDSQNGEFADSNDHAIDDLSPINTRVFSLLQNGMRPKSSPTAHSEARSEPSTELLDVKVERKRAENELQLLINRVALLRTEEKKGLNKVAEAKMRAKEILSNKKRHEDDLQAKISNQLNREAEIRESARRAAMERDERKMKISMSRKLIYDSKKSLVFETRDEAKRLNDMQQQNRMTSELEKRMRAQEERKRKEDIRRKREKDNLEREKMSQLLHNRKVAEEINRRVETEELIKELEREEREVIERLKRTEALQKKAFDVLQRSIDT